jgi:CheY-like chemotaxis protein
VLGITSGHGGALHLWSVAGKGTRIRLALPALAQQAGESAQAPTPGTPAQLQGTVLIADDEPPIRLVLATMLRRLGLEVLEAEDGFEAVQLFEAHRDRVRVVMLDLVMPRLDGAHALRELRHLDPDLPVVLVSGYDLSEVTEALGDHEPSGFLQKPFDMGELQLLLGRVLEA